MVLAAASANTILQTIVDDRLRGRVAGFFMLSFLGVAPLGNLAAGALAAKIGVPATFLVNVVSVSCAGRGARLQARAPGAARGFEKDAA